MAEYPYRRVLLKLSGGVFQGADGRALDFDAIGGFCDQLAEAHAAGLELALVVGGGNVLRGARSEETGTDRPTRDAMGMLATVINALALEALLAPRGVSARVLTPVPMGPMTEVFSRRAALEHLAAGRVVVFGGGTGHPFFSTDTAAALRASEVGAEVLMKASDVDGVYDADPRTCPDATRYDALDYDTALSKGLRVMDPAAFALCRENRIPVFVFNLRAPGSIMQALQGKAPGTLVGG